MSRQKAKKHAPLPLAVDSFDNVPNHLPSAQDRMRVEQLIKELNIKENALTLRLTRARKPQVATTSKELEVTRTRIANMRCFLAPIRTLPVELLSYILQVAFNAGQSPWTFAHVSHSFRTVTFNTPLMWNRILLRTIPTTVRNQDGIETCRTTAHLVDAIVRSKKAPLTLTLELRPPTRQEVLIDPVHLSLPKTLNMAADRIQSLTILDLGMEALPMNLITKELKDLQFLQVSGTARPRACYQSLLTLVDKTALHLHTLKLLISPTFVTPDKTCWQRLTSLEVVGFPPLAVLSQCLSLRSLLLRTHATSRNSAEPLRSPPVILPNLEHFTADFFPVTLLRSLLLPSLHSLDIDSTQHSIATEAFHPFPSLLFLQIKGRFTVDPSCFITPSLTHLTLSGVRLGGGVLTTPRHYQDWPLTSKLTRLTLENIVDETNAVQVMLRHYTEITYLSIIFITSTPSIIRSLWSTARPTSGESSVGSLCPSLKKVRLKYKSDRYKQVAILGMLQALAMMRESAEIPLERITFVQFRHGTAIAREVLPLSREHQETGSDSDQSTCDACHGYHG